MRFVRCRNISLHRIREYFYTAHYKNYFGAD